MANTTPGIHVEGQDAIKLRLLKLTQRYGTTYRVRVGYEALHAVYQHEATWYNHPNGGEAKYLEKPARRFARRIGQIVAASVKNGMSLKDSLYAGGLYLKVKSQEIVPVDTGELRDSAYVKVSNA